MECIFLNPAGTTLFVRDDMEEGHWVQQEMNLTASFPFNPNKKIESGQRIAFRDPATNILQMFEVNIVTNQETDHYQQITAEHIVISELNDEHINKQKITAKTALEALTTALTGTLWTAGNSTASGTQDADFSRGSVWNAINTIQQNWNVYITPRITMSSAGVITGKYLDIAPAEGIWRGLRLSVQKNLLDPAVTYDESDVYTALYGYGGTVDKPRTGQDDEPEELTFADEVWTQTSSHPAKPAGQTYLEWPEKTALYGRNGRPRYGYYQNGNIKTASLLLEKTWESLQQCAQPKISIAGGCVDLHRLGYHDQPIRLHDQAIIEIEETGELFYKQIICCDVDLIDPTGTRVEIGDYIPNIIYINREEAKKSGGGGGGRGPGSQNDLEENMTYFDSEFIKDSQLIGMVVGLKDGSGYIKAASIVASINDEHGTNITLNADTIDIGDLLSAISGEGITCTDLDCIGSVSVDQNISCEGSITGYTIIAENGLEIQGGLLDCLDIDCNGINAASLKVPDGYLIVDAKSASWQTYSARRVTLSNQYNFRYESSGGASYGTVYGRIVTGYSDTTLHYLGYPDSGS